MRMLLPGLHTKVRAGVILEEDTAGDVCVQDAASCCFGGTSRRAFEVTRMRRECEIIVRCGSQT